MPNTDTAPAGNTVPAAPQNISLLTAVLLAVLTSTAASISSVYVYDHYYAQKIAVMDLQGFLTDQKKLLQEKKITSDELIKSLDRVEKAVDSVPKNTVVLLKEVVMRNAAFEIQP